MVGIIGRFLRSLDGADRINFVLGSAGLLGSVLMAQREMRALREKSNARRTKGEGETKMRIQDHPLVPWLIENGTVFGLVGLLPVRKIADLDSSKTVFRLKFLASFAGQVLQAYSLQHVMILIQHFLVYKVYAHIPFFNTKNRPATELDARKALFDWIKTNGVVHIIGAAAQTAFMLKLDNAKKRQLRNPQKFSLLKFLAKFGYVRIVNDIVFYLAHRALHSKLLYSMHKRHHEHINCALVTNFHFSAADLFIEAFIPAFAGLSSLSALGVRVSHYESLLCFTFLFWYEMASHSGKPMPTATMFPPLSILYRNLFPSIDADTVKYHESHHNFCFCNFGITQWLDKFMGSHRLKK